MLDSIINIDTQLFLWLNSFNNKFFDDLMYLISDKYFWIPFYLFLIFIIYRKFGIKKTLILLLVIILCFALADLISNELFKKPISRLRPSHNPNLYNDIHIVNNYRGGKYGFVSSHAANTFSLATIIYLIFDKQKVFLLLFLWALIVSYSRIYLGVHYTLDIMVGGFLGMIISYIVYLLTKKILQNINGIM